MTKVTFPIPKSQGTASLRQRRWLIVTILAIAGSTVWAATNGAEQNDSGWAVGIPSPLGYGAKSVDPHQQSILRGVLEDTQRPLLQKRSPSSSAQAGAEQAHAGMRFAVRPDGVDGWRAVGQSSTPLSGHGQVHAAPSLPALHAATATTTDDTNTDELDCSGDAAEPQQKPTTSATGARHWQTPTENRRVHRTGRRC